MIDVKIDDKIRIHADGMVLIVHDSDVVDSVQVEDSPGDEAMSASPCLDDAVRWVTALGADLR